MKAMIKKDGIQQIALGLQLTCCTISTAGEVTIIAAADSESVVLKVGPDEIGHIRAALTSAEALAA